MSELNKESPVTQEQLHRLVSAILDTNFNSADPLYSILYDLGEIIKIEPETINGETLTVQAKPSALSAGTLCRLMDDCLPEQIEDERDMQALIDKLWPALCCEFEVER